MDDSLNRAFAEAAPRGHLAQPGDVAEYRTPHLRNLGSELESLREQLLATMASPFFDDEARAEVIPVVKHLGAELGTVKVLARKRTPAFEAVASIEVRSDRDPDDASHESGRFHVRAKLALAGIDAGSGARCEHAFAVHEIDGKLELDAPDLREKLAQAIREVGKP